MNDFRERVNRGLDALQTADLLGSSDSVAALDAELAIQMFLDASEQKAARFRASSSPSPPRSLQKEPAPNGNPSMTVSLPGNVFAAAHRSSVDYSCMSSANSAAGRSGHRILVPLLSSRSAFHGIRASATFTALSSHAQSAQSPLADRSGSAGACAAAGPALTATQPIRARHDLCPLKPAQTLATSELCEQHLTGTASPDPLSVAVHTLQAPPENNTLPAHSDASNSLQTLITPKNLLFPTVFNRLFNNFSK